MSRPSLARPLLIPRPPCPQCGAPMMMARIQQHASALEERTYRCSKCRFAENLLVKVR